MQRAINAGQTNTKFIMLILLPYYINIIRQTNAINVDNNTIRFITIFIFNLKIIYTSKNFLYQKLSDLTSTK